MKLKCTAQKRDRWASYFFYKQHFSFLSFPHYIVTLIGIGQAGKH